MGDNFEQLKRDIIENPDLINELSEEDIIRLSEAQSQPGVEESWIKLPNVNKSWINVTLINWKDEYFKRFYGTAVRQFYSKKATDWLVGKSDEYKRIVAEFVTDVIDAEPSEGWGQIAKDYARVEIMSLLSDINKLFQQDFTTAAQAISWLNPEDPWQKSAQTRLKTFELRLKTDSAPPMDTFLYHLNRYIVNNYEELRESMGEYKVDMDYSIIYYDSYKTSEEAAQARRKWADTFMLDVYTIENGGVTLLGPWKKNRDSIEFGEKDGDTITQMMKRHIDDAAIGKELMTRRVREQKAKNIEECGKDAGGLNTYIKAINTIKALGTKPQSELTETEMKQLHVARNIKESAETPAGSIGVDVWTTDGDNMTKTKMYTEAEAPRP